MEIYLSPAVQFSLSGAEIMYAVHRSTFVKAPCYRACGATFHLWAHRLLLS